MPAHAERHPGDIVRVGAGTALLALTAYVASRGGLSEIERHGFGVVNKLPDAVSPPLTVVMQAGALAAVPVAAGVALVFRRPRLAAALAVSGASAWVLAKVVKELVDRERPAGLVEDTITRGDIDNGLGFPSGHTAVAAALATTLCPYLPRWGRRTVWTVVGVVGVARMFVGAHLPIDIVGGFALGWVVGAGTNLVLGAPGWKPDLDALRALFLAHGMPVATITPLSVDARASAPMLVRTEAGDEVFTKLVSNEERNADALFKAWRFLLYRKLEDEEPFPSARREVEHEAFLSLLADRAGVRTPRLVVAGPVTSTVAALGEQHVPGRSLDSTDPTEMTDEVLATLWQEVAKLRAARIAHRDLRLGNVMVDDDGKPWIIDFGFSEAEASDTRMAEDVAELLASLATFVGAARASRAAVGALGAQAVAAAVPLLQPLALSGATRNAMHHHKGLLKELQKEAAAAAGVEVPPLERLTRVRLRTVLMMAVLGIAFYVLLPQLGDFESSVDAIEDADWWWILASLVASALTYVSAAIQLQGSSPKRLDLVHTIEDGLASSFTNRITPAGLGGVATNIRYLQRNGLDVPVAASTYALNAAVSAVVHMSSLFVSAIVAGQRGTRAVPLPTGWRLLVIIAVGLAVVGIVVLLPTIRRRILPSLRSVGSSFRIVVTQPGQLARLVLGAIGVITFYIASFALALRAVGVHLPISEVIFVYLGGAVISSVAPTPGGLGAMEAALTAGLTAFGAPPGPALAGVLTFRLLTYWLPILPGWWSFRRLRKLELL